MTESAVPWLPSSALGDARTAEPVARAVHEWSTAWLASGSLAVPPRWEACDPALAGMGYAIAHEADGHRLLRHEDATPELASLLLGRELGEREGRTGHDRAVIEHLVATALAALAAALGDVLDGEAEARDADWFALPIAGEGGTPVLRLEVARAVLVSLAHAWAGPTRKAGSLFPRGTSLQPQPVRLAARIGTSRLALPEIEALGMGDVLTLDTPLSAAIDARIDDAPAGRAALSLVPGGDVLRLRIERPAHQW